MIPKEQYLTNPCKITSIPYWKMKSTAIPANMKIVHKDNYIQSEYHQYTAKPYFRLYHDLRTLHTPQIPEGFSLCRVSLKEYADHINKCYKDICTSEAELCNYTNHPVYNADLWIAVADKQSGAIVATGIAEFDRETGEGILEWIQVSEDYRRHGLGSYIVRELLWRMRDTAKFATVSGQCNNPTNPEQLYRKCGFTGTDVWFILKKREHTI